MRTATTFISAAKEGDITACKLQLERGADANDADNDGAPLLHFAAEAGHTEIVKLLLEHGADVNVKKNRTGITPLLYAAREGHTEICRQLLEYGANLDAEDELDKALLYLAAACTRAAGNGQVAARAWSGGQCERHARRHSPS